MAETLRNGFFKGDQAQKILTQVNRYIGPLDAELGRTDAPNSRRGMRPRKAHSWILNGEDTQPNLYGPNDSDIQPLLPFESASTLPVSSSSLTTAASSYRYPSNRYRPCLPCWQAFDWAIEEQINSRGWNSGLRGYSVTLVLLHVVFQSFSLLLSKFELAMYMILYMTLVYGGVS